MPILIQNANGPCPLLALVNALSLSITENVQSGLWKILRGREHVSLRLLLEGVVDELIRRRGGDVAQGLPDVGDLYAFLTTLHTGMNVNPRLVPEPKAPPNLIDAPADSVEILPSTGEDDVAPGSFEDTPEMQLYGTFSVPLVHGWLPSKEHPAYTALQRSAKTHEDAVLLLCREDELEAKLRVEGLDRAEQQLLQNLAIVKYFLGQTATQLTMHGLNVLKRSMAPGALFILFRNNHFSTIYKHPHSNQLLQLVTDMGYAAHDGVVWESLVDTTGEGSEFLGGDFRPVRVNMNQRSSSPMDGSSTRSYSNHGSASHNGNWNAVSQSHDGNTGIASIDERLDQSSNCFETFAADPAGSPNPSTEQEDHDLALALQLQEEEEDLHQRDVAARQREEKLSREVLSREIPPPNPRRRSGRRSGGRGGQVVRPLVPPPTATQSGPIQPPPVDPIAEDAPPPTYEQAASDAAYHPPLDRPAHFSNPIRRVVTGEPMGESGRQAGPHPPLPSRGGRMGSGPPVTNPRGHHQTLGRAGRQSMSPTTSGSERGNGGVSKRDCVVM